MSALYTQLWKVLTGKECPMPQGGSAVYIDGRRATTEYFHNAWESLFKGWDKSDYDYEYYYGISTPTFHGVNCKAERVRLMNSPSYRGRNLDQDPFKGATHPKNQVKRKIRNARKVDDVLPVEVSQPIHMSSMEMLEAFNPLRGGNPEDAFDGKYF